MRDADVTAAPSPAETNTASPAETIARFENSSTRVETPNGDGKMVWHIWGSGPVLALFRPDAGAARDAVRELPAYQKPDLAVGDSFALSEGITCALPFIELGFPSYSHHCLLDEPYLGFSGARILAGRLLNCLQAR